MDDCPLGHLEGDPVDGFGGFQGLDGAASPVDLLAEGRAAADSDVMVDWAAFHAIGDVLRAQSTAPSALRADFVSRLLDKVAAEPSLAAPVQAQVSFMASHLPSPSLAAPAANDPVFRWKLVAGLASFSAAAVLTWTALGGANTPAGQGSALALAVPAAVPVVVTTGLNTGATNVMIRDPHLDAMLAAHKQFGGSSALQGPSGFLRNATFDTSSR
jgi:sigma-E factor negative regulatory protein RseA